ncbi:MAG: methyl-accepting chemotaxis protein [Curvibacter sp.]|jgi:methyl-accepting chemotaxis protein
MKTSLPPSPYLLLAFLLVAILATALAVGVAAWAIPGMALRMAVVGSGVLAVGVLLMLAVLVHRSYVRPLGVASQAVRQLVKADLSVPVVSSEQSETELLQSLEALREQTLVIIADVRRRMFAIATSAGQILGDQTNFSAAVRSQAAALESTASSFQELTATVQQAADNSRQSQQHARSAMELASEGGSLMQRAVQTMGSIREGSRRIADITGVIDGIAFQTNILALNAAVEAARAGESGRGFAVVAGEVRTLAQRSAQAAKEIKALIDESVRSIDEGAHLVDGTGLKMSLLVQSVREVSRIMDDMTVSAEEQSASVKELYKTVVDIDGATQQNADLMERAADPVKALSTQAANLTRALEMFQLGEREFGSRDEAVNLVQRAVAFAAEHGEQALIDDVNRLEDGQFVDRDLYLSLYSLSDYRIQAHGTNSRLVGIDGAAVKDVQGKLFVAEIVNEARASGSGWMQYQWTNPLTQKQGTKIAYFERQGTVVVSCGAYSS